MTAIDDIVRSFREKVSAEIELEREGINRYIVYTPFMFDDGDHYVVILQEEGGRWVLSDEGHTFMHLSYTEVNLESTTRSKIIDQALATYSVSRVQDELRAHIPDAQYGDALFSFVQALDRISATALWTKDRVKSAFMDEFQEFMSAVVPTNRLTFDYTDPANDPEGNYKIDCRINHMPTPWFVFAVNNNQRAKDATIACYHYEKLDTRFRSAVIFEDQKDINRRTLAQLSAVVTRQFPSLGERQRITRFIEEDVLAS